MLDDLAHSFGEDLQLSPTGDLARVNGVERSRQRVLRRLLTNPRGYLSHLDYGAGVPAQIGQALEAPRLQALIRTQALLEASVAQAPPPRVGLQPILNGVAVSVEYLAEPDAVPAALTFTVGG